MIQKQPADFVKNVPIGHQTQDLHPKCLIFIENYGMIERVFINIFCIFSLRGEGMKQFQFDYIDDRQ
uniref:hypothetical protein n=1 Tax=uncultured Ruminococcus sp. TaxID=165186 RepID=UPI0025FFBB25